MSASRDGSRNDCSELEDVSESTNSLKDPGMFDGLTAWFSVSVNPKYIAAWEQADGLRTELDKALYLFSEDATAPDTESIYSSTAYLSDSITVFHPMYITSCLEAGSLKKVPIGKFFFPPEDVQKAIAGFVTFCWKTENNVPSRTNSSSDHNCSSSLSTTNTRPAAEQSQQLTIATPAIRETTSQSIVHSSQSGSLPTDSVSRMPHSKSRQSVSVSSRADPSMRKSQTSSILIPPSSHGSVPSHFSVKPASLSANVRRKELCVLGVSRHQAKHLSNSVSIVTGPDLNDGNRSVVSKETNHKRKSLDMENEYISVESLDSYAGPLNDFIPNQNGCHVTH